MIGSMSMNYVLVAIGLLYVQLVYRYVLNRHNRIEYYYFENCKYRYRMLRYSILFLNVVMLFYMRFIFLELIKLV